MKILPLDVRKKMRKKSNSRQLSSGAVGESSVMTWKKSWIFFLFSRYNRFFRKIQPKLSTKLLSLAEEQLECLALWKEGSNRYLVGRVHNGNTPTSNEDRYRCFVYERAGQSVTGGLNRAANAAALGMTSVLDHEIVAAAARPIPEGTPEIYQVAQSGDATCNGLFSPLEGSRTMTLTKGETNFSFILCMTGRKKKTRLCEDLRMRGIFQCWRNERFSSTRHAFSK